MAIFYRAIGIFAAATLMTCVSTALAASSVGLPPAVVFDLDDTLFDVRGRNLEIFDEIAEKLNEPLLHGHTTEEIDSYCAVALPKIGITSVEKITAICGDASDPVSLRKSEWGRLFFSNSYLRYDRAVPGGSTFIQKLKIDFPGVTILYLTGRSSELMRSGTLREISYNGFPISDAELITKPERYAGDDVAFKRDYIHILTKSFNILAVFDDSKGNVNMFREELDPAIPVIKPTADLSKLNGVNPGIMPITNYLYDVTGSGNARSVVSNREKLINLEAQMRARLSLERKSDQ